MKTNKQFTVTLRNDEGQLVRTLLVKASSHAMARRYGHWHVAMHKLEVSDIMAEEEKR